MSEFSLEKITPFDRNDHKIAERLDIVLPELWITDKYDQRLALANVCMELDPDKLVKAFDRLQIDQRFGIVFDSLDYEDGPETDRLYQTDKGNRRAIYNLPFFELRADPTPTAEEDSERLTDLGLLLGAKVMDDLLEYERAAELQKTKSKRAKTVSMGGAIAHIGTAAGNIVARSAHLYNMVPYLGAGAGVAVIGGGIAARVVSIVKSKNIEKQDIHDFTETEVEEAVRKVADDTKIVSFVPTEGLNTLPRHIMHEIQAELDAIDPSTNT